MTALTESSTSLKLLEAMPQDTFVGIRQEAVSFLNENGIPSKKHEDWKYTNVKRLFDNGLHFAPAKDITFNLVDGVETRFIASDLETDSETRSIASPQIGSTGIHTKEAHAALNTALFGNVLIIRVKKDLRIEEELILNQAIELAANSFSATRLLVVLEESASLKCQLHFSGSTAFDASLHNHVTEVFVGKNAHFEFNIVQEINQGNLVNITEVVCERDANFTTNTFQLSGKLLRNNLNIRLKGENIGTHLNGFYMLNGTELFDNHTHVDHFEPNCNSNEIYRGILAGRSTGVFNGKVFVHRDAQKTNGYQSNNNILLSDEATMNSKPELEIYADDVKCSHGSTTGQLDEEAVFYLRARGLDEFGATALLLTAFAGDVLKAVSSEMLRSKLEQKIQDKLNAMRA